MGTVFTGRISIRSVYPMHSSSSRWDEPLFIDRLMEISVFEPMINGAFEMGAFRVPKDNADDPCYISDHTDIGIGMNVATKYPEAVKIFLNWVATPEFATLYANNMVGFYPLAKIDYTIENPVAQEFLSWRKDCQSSIRIFRFHYWTRRTGDGYRYLADFSQRD